MICSAAAATAVAAARGAAAGEAASVHKASKSGWFVFGAWRDGGIGWAEGDGG